VKLIDHTYSCNSLTNFENDAHTIIRNESDETCCEKIVKSRQVNLVLAGFSHLEPLHQLPTTVLSQIMERKSLLEKNMQAYLEPI